MVLKHEMSIESRPSNTPYKNIVKIFERYEIAQRRGKKVSLEELGRGLASQSHVGKVIDRVGVWPMYGKRIGVKRFSIQNKDLIEKVYELGMNERDVAYFLDLTPVVVGIRLRERKVTTGSGHNAPLLGLNELNYRLASQIYEAQDLGFNPSEIAQLLTAKDKVVNHAIGNRALIETPIIKALRISYNNSKYNKPYKT